jgi:hypothetical protein
MGYKVSSENLALQKGPKLWQNVSKHFRTRDKPLMAAASSFHRLLGGSYQAACFYLFPLLASGRWIGET